MDSTQDEFVVPSAVSTGFITPQEIAVSQDDLVARVPTARYGAIAFEIALGIMPLEHIARTFNITLDVIRALSSNATFTAELLAVRDMLGDKGKNQGFTNRARALVEHAMPGMYELMTDPKTPPKDRMQLFGQFVRYARLDPDLDKSAGPQLNVSMHFSSGIRGISDNAKVIDG